jgi:hypothetical protein
MLLRVLRQPKFSGISTSVHSRNLEDDDDKDNDDDDGDGDERDVYPDHKLYDG